MLLVILYFENTKFCDAFIKECELTAQKKKKIQYKYSTVKYRFLKYLGSEYRNKPNRDENANTKRDGAWIKKRKENTRHQIEATAHEAE